MNCLQDFFFFFAIFLLQEFFLGKLSPVRSNGPPLNVLYIEITSWLVSAYDFYSRVVRIRKRTSEPQRASEFSESSKRMNKNSTSKPTMK